MEEQLERKTPVPNEQKEFEHLPQDLEEEQENLTEDHEDQDLVGRSLSTTPDSGVDLLENEQEVFKNVVIAAVEENGLVNQLSDEPTEENSNNMEENKSDILFDKETESKGVDEIENKTQGLC